MTKIESIVKDMYGKHNHICPKLKSALIKRNAAIILYFETHHNNVSSVIAKEFKISERIVDNAIERYLSTKKNYMGPLKNKQ